MKKKNTEEITLTFATSEDVVNFERVLRVLKVPKAKSRVRSIELKYK